MHIDRSDAADERCWQPQLFEARSDHAAAALAALCASGRVQRQVDLVPQMLRELAVLRAGARPPAADQLAERVDAERGGVPLANIGTWVFYPWSGMLLRVLDRARFRALRTHRNQLKITAAEQRRLERCRVGIVGLSSGHFVATCLAREGCATRFRLADFDTVSASNLNRLSAPLHAIGLKKTTNTARQLLEIDPFLQIEIFDEGITPGNLDAFFDGTDGAQPLSLLFEICDGIETKLTARYAARARRVPVLMINSEGGIADVERFDLEPERPILHGLVEEVEPSSLRSMTAVDKLAFLLPIVGFDNLTDRMVASGVEIGSTLSTWPQLASGVMLGAGIISDVARRILLDEMTASGRFTVPVHRLVSDDVPEDVRTPSAMAVLDPTPPEPDPPLPELSAVALQGDLNAHLRALTAWAGRAASGGNAQPWRFVALPRGLAVYPVVDEPTRSMDPDLIGARLGIGAATANIELAAARLGRQAVISWTRSPEEASPWAQIDLSGRITPHEDPLLKWIPLRRTIRAAASGRPPDAADRAALAQHARDRGARLLIVDGDRVAQVAAIAAESDRIRCLQATLRAHFLSELRWSKAAVEATRDGLDVRMLGLPATELPGLLSLQRGAAWELLARNDGARRLGWAAQEVYAQTHSYALMVAPPGTSPSWLTLGAVIQRTWLEATARGLAIAPTTILLWLQRLRKHPASPLQAPWGGRIATLDGQLRGLFGVEPDERLVFLFRLSRAPAQGWTALRRPPRLEPG
jgi:molybdopterin/thiamine biosynthesis adenylyltransferase